MTTVNNYVKLLHWHKVCHNIASKATDTVLNAPELLAAVSHSMLIISLRLASRASFPHRFQVPVTLVPTLNILLVLSLEQQWFT